jgi:WhiB family redox-sensing transcriptional regulator
MTTLPQTEPAWRCSARCRGDDAVHFFAPNHFERKPEKDAREGAARALCRACPVRRDCLEHSLATGERHGIWGGLNELERRRLLRRRVAEAEQQTA